MKERVIWIPVVAGVMKKNDKFLVGKRPQHGSLPGLWEFIGGKVEREEEVTVTLQREFYEELDIKIIPGDFLFSINKKVTENRCVLILFFSILKWEGQPSTATPL